MVISMTGDLRKNYHSCGGCYNIVTTIDGNIQQIVEKYLYEFNETYKNQAVQEMEPECRLCYYGINNGNVLAMANYPNFNLNNPRDKSSS